MQGDGAIDQHLLGLDVLGIWKAALDGAHRLTGLVIIEADALGAQVGIDDVDLVTLGDGVVRALGLAGAAVDAIVSDEGRHAVRCWRAGI